MTLCGGLHSCGAGINLSIERLKRGKKKKRIKEKKYKLLIGNIYMLKCKGWK